MRYSNPAPIDPSPLRRLLASVRAEPEKAITFWCAIGILIFTAMVGGAFVVETKAAARQKADLQDAPLQAGTATVEVMQYRTSKGPAPYADVQLGLRVNGRLTIAGVPNDARTAQLHVGDRLKVNYKTGRSGAIYIDNWQPLPR